MMLTILRNIIEKYQNFLDDCVLLYIDSICEDVTSSYVKTTSNIHTLNKCYNMYVKSLTNFIEFKNFCKHTNDKYSFDLNSKLFHKMIRNTFYNLKIKYKDKYVIKNYINTKSITGRYYHRFFEFCMQLFVQELTHTNVNIDILKNKKVFVDFCEYMKLHCCRFTKIEVNCNLYKVFFEDTLYKLSKIL